MYQAYELMKQYENENNIKYDLVCRIRFDIEIISLQIENIEHLEEYYNFLIEGVITEGPDDKGDKFLISTNDNMCKYFRNMYYNSINIFNELENIGLKNVWKKGYFIEAGHYIMYDYPKRFNDPNYIKITKKYYFPDFKKFKYIIIKILR